MTARRRTTETAHALRRMARAWLHAYEETAGLWRVSPGMGPTAPIRFAPPRHAAPVTEDAPPSARGR